MHRNRHKHPMRLRYKIQAHTQWPLPHRNLFCKCMHIGVSSDLKSVTHTM